MATPDDDFCSDLPAAEAEAPSRALVVPLARPSRNAQSPGFSSWFKAYLPAFGWRAPA